MKAYLIITGSIFGLITAAHIWRIAAESHSLATEPWFMGLTILAAAMCIWAVRLLRGLAKA